MTFWFSKVLMFYFVDAMSALCKWAEKMLVSWGHVNNDSVAEGKEGVSVTATLPCLPGSQVRVTEYAFLSGELHYKPNAVLPN